jgi:hypothetical protein
MMQMPVLAVVAEARGSSFYQKDLVFTIHISGYNGENKGGGGYDANAPYAGGGKRQQFLSERPCFYNSYFRVPC